MSKVSKKKIALIGPAGIHNSGLSSYIQNFSLSFKNHDVTIIDDKINTSSFTSMIKSIYNFLTLHSNLTRHNSDLVMLHNNSISFSFLLKYYQVIICKIINKKFTIRVGAGDFFFKWYSNSNLIWKFIIKSYFNSSDGIIVQSNKDLGRMSKIISSQKLTKINNFLADRFAHSKFERRRNRYKKCVLLISGKDKVSNHAKGLYRVSDFIEQNLNKLESFHFLCINSDFSFQQYCKKKAITHKIKFLPQLSRNSIMKTFSFSDIFILYSEYEGQPNTIIEAIAHGCKVIATPVGSVNEMNQDKNIIDIIEMGKSNSLLNALNRNVNLENDERIKIKSFFKNNFSQKVFQSHMIDFVNRVIDK